MKIKAFIIFVAWLTIFAHSVIPHNHAEELCSSCNGLIHSTSVGIEDQSKSLKYEPRDEDEKLCHISNFLFNNFNPEEFFIFSSKEIRCIPVCVATGLYVDSDQPFFSLHSFSAASLRAPPAV